MEKKLAVASQGIYKRNFTTFIKRIKKKQNFSKKKLKNDQKLWMD